MLKLDLIGFGYNSNDEQKLLFETILLITCKGVRLVSTDTGTIEAGQMTTILSPIV